MYKIVHETWLTKLVDLFGNEALLGIMSTIYSSSIYKFCLFLFVSTALVSLGLGIHRRQLSPRLIYVCFALIALAPVRGQPCAFVVINTLGSAGRYVFEAGVNTVISGKSLHSERDNMPPGLVMEAIIQAATNNLEDEGARARIHGFVLNCLPNALTLKGEHATFEDLFQYMTVLKEDISGQTITTYIEASLDAQSLKNDDSYGRFEPGKNCYQGLVAMRRRLTPSTSDAGDMMLVNHVVHDYETKPDDTTSAWFRNWKASGPRFKDLAANLATAAAASYEKSLLIESLGSSYQNKVFAHEGADASIRELLLSSGNSATFGYASSNVKDIVSNTTGTRWAFSLGAALKDLKERIELMPYQLAAIKLLLKIIFPFALLTLFMQTFRFLSLWAGAWTVSLLIPSVTSAARSIGNTILLSKLGIQKLAESGGYKALAHGVDLSVAENFISDFNPMAYSLVQQELTVIRVLAGVTMLGSWIAGGGANGFVSWLSNSVQGTMVGSLTSAAHRAGGVAAPALLKTIGSGGVLLGNSMAQGASRVVKSVRSSEGHTPTSEANQASIQNRLPRRQP